jgi:LmbE family N-acetylglucosaminyl deacetylase
MAILAHPDDEAIGLGGHLAEREFTLVHVTDGAPSDMRDARAHGFRQQADYARARREELAAAVAEVGMSPRSLLCLGLTDQEAALHLASLSHRLASLIEDRAPAAVFTHAYEGGHPDHDATAFATRAACRLLERRCGRAPILIDMPFYHSERGRMVTQVFAPSPAAPSFAAPLNCRASMLKQAMFRRHRTQQSTLAQFQTSVERFRLAPLYDFAEVPNGGELYYERFSWGLDGPSWRMAARDALAELRLASWR